MLKISFIFTPNELESRAEHIQRADKQVEEAEQQDELHNPSQHSYNLAFCVQLWRAKQNPDSETGSVKEHTVCCKIKVLSHLTTSPPCL